MNCVCCPWNSSDGTYTYSYDQEGNRHARFIDDGDGSLGADDADVTLYAWDWRNRLGGETHYASYAALQSNISDWIVTYSYDAFDRLIRRGFDDDGTGGDHSMTYRYDVYQGDNPLLEFSDPDGLGNSGQPVGLAHRYLYGPAVDEILAVDGGGSGTVYWGLGDHEGTIRDVVRYNPTSKKADVFNHVQYDSYGKVLSSSNSAADFLFGFDGMRYDARTGEYRTQQRVYDPRTGRLLSEDPLGTASGTTNFTAWCGNNPINNTDPTGMCSESNNTTAEPSWVWPWDSRASWNPVSTAKLWGGAAVAGAVRTDQFAGQVNAAVWTGTWVDPSTTSGVGVAWAATKGAGQGAVNIAVGTGKSVREMGYMAADFTNASLEATTGYTMYNGDLSGSMQALTTGQVGLGQYYGEFGANTVTLGVYGEGKTLYQLGTGQITVDQASEQIGSTAVFQLAGAKLMSMRPTGGMPAQLAQGQAAEAEILSNLNLPKNTTVWRPTVAQTQSAGFQVVVGEPQFTPGGLPVGTVVDVTQGGLMEIKTGSSILNSSYQLRLQTYQSLIENKPFTIQTTRPVNPTFQNYLQRWGVKVEPPR